MEALWDSVLPEDWHLPSQEWLTEIQRRSQELDEVSMTVAPWPEVHSARRSWLPQFPPAFFLVGEGQSTEQRE